VLPLDRTFEFRGDAVAWTTLGAGEPVVFVHGTPFSAHVWRRIAGEIARTRQVYLFDLLGYGQSAKRAGQDVSLGVQNELLSALLAHWGLECPFVVGHDFGGATVLRAHLLNGCDYSSLVLIDPVAIRPWGSPFVQHVRAHEAAFQGIPAYMHEAMVAAYIRGAVHRPMSDAELVPYITPWLGEAGQPAFYRQIAQMDVAYTDAIESILASIRCPVRILWGEADGWIPVAQGRELARRIPHTTLRTIPAAGHLVQEDAPEILVAEILRAAV
jgi:pimeloyl-ACP methyl ester carboxylesterase